MESNRSDCKIVKFAIALLLYSQPHTLPRLDLQVCKSAFQIHYWNNQILNPAFEKAQYVFCFLGNVFLKSYI